MKREITRTKGDRFCTLEIELTDDRLSIRGTEGRIVKRAVAKKDALQYWIDFFEESPDERRAMGERFNRTFRTARAAARFVLETDGEFHGLDVQGSEDAARLRIVESCGQITETLVAFFPEVQPYLRWHLNDMRAGCEHQEAEGWADRPIDPSKPTNTYGEHFPGQRQPSWNMLAWVSPDEHPEGLLTKPCPTCGYRYGTQWLKRELPPEVRHWAETFGKPEDAAQANV